MGSGPSTTKPISPDCIQPSVDSVKSVSSINAQPLRVWYTNADQFLNKIDELKLRIDNSSIKPEIIAITEVNPKHRRYQLNACELSLDGYTAPIYNPAGRGMCIYLPNYIDLIDTKCTPHRTDAFISLSAKDKLCISCFYRSPSNSIEENYDFINDLKS